MNMFKKTLIASALVAASVAVQAEVSTNIGVTSDYVWRGMTQAGGEASVSGGIDYSDGSGFYSGAWVGSLSGDSELDLYGGYGTDSFDVGYILYYYSQADENFGEVYGSYSIESFTFGLAYTVNADAGFADTADLYYYASYGTDINEDWSVGFTIGQTDYDNGSEVLHYGVDFSSGDFTFSLTDSDMDNDEPRAVVSYGLSF